MRDFVDGYFDEMARHLQNVPRDAVDRIGQRLYDSAQAGAQILLAGNGGSASTASHFACDLAKTVLGSKPELRRSRFRVVSLADNTALLTAWANDASYDQVFAQQVKMLGRPGDVLCLISASGSSPNVVRAAEVASSLGIQTVGFLGCDGGRLRELVDDYVLVACDDYGHIESVHLVLGHMLTHWLRDALADDANV